jgi:hypothetical protein
MFLILMNQQNMRKTGPRYCLRILLLTFLVPQALPQNEKSNASEFIYDSRLIFLHVTVEHFRDRLFLLDTGASASAIDLKTAEELKLKFVGNSDVEGSGGTIRAKTVRIKNLSVGGSRVSALKIPSYDLSGSFAPQGMRLDGILGYDFLRNFAVEIDFPNRVIRFLKKPPESPIAERSGVLSFKLDNGIPRFPALLSDAVRTELRLDTGASLFETQDVYINITERTWDKLVETNPALKPEKFFTGSGVGGAVKLPVARVNGFSIGPFTFPSAFVIVQPEQGYFARPDAVGFVSNNLLDKMSPVVIDYLGEKLYFTKK